MRAVVITQPGGPEVLSLVHRPDPAPGPGEVLIAVEAFGLNHAELYFRRGIWPGAEISGIECVGEVAEDPDGKLARGTKVLAAMGGLGRTRDGSYAELVAVPRANVLPVETDLPWEELAALPESYATAWCCVVGNLGLRGGETVVVRGATSALGQAAVNIAAGAGARVVATTRRAERAALLARLGAARVLVGIGSAAELAECGIVADCVLDLVGTSTLRDSCAMARRGGRVCVAGFLGGTAPLDGFDPVFQLPGGVQLSAFASALALGGPDYPLEAVPFAEILRLAAQGRYQAKPARCFRLTEVAQAHTLMEAHDALGKLVVRVH